MQTPWGRGHFGGSMKNRVSTLIAFLSTLSLTNPSLAYGSDLMSTTPDTGGGTMSCPDGTTGTHCPNQSSAIQSSHTQSTPTPQSNAHRPGRASNPQRRGRRGRRRPQGGKRGGRIDYLQSQIDGLIGKKLESNFGINYRQTDPPPAQTQAPSQTQTPASDSTPYQGVPYGSAEANDVKPFEKFAPEKHCYPLVRQDYRNLGKPTPQEAELNSKCSKGEFLSQAREAYAESNPICVNNDKIPDQKITCQNNENGDDNTYRAFIVTGSSKCNENETAVRCTIRTQANLDEMTQEAYLRSNGLNKINWKEKLLEAHESVTDADALEEGIQDQVKQKEVQKDEAQAYYNELLSRKGSTSEKLGYKRAQKTQEQAETYQGVRLATQAVGSTAVGVMGQMAQINAMNSNSPTAAYDASASVTRNTARMQAVVAAAELAAGIHMETSQAEHESNLEEIEEGSMDALEAIDRQNANAETYAALTGDGSEEKLTSGKGGYVETGDSNFMGKVNDASGSESLNSLYAMQSDVYRDCNADAGNKEDYYVCQEAKRRERVAQYQDKTQHMSKNIRKIANRAHAEQNEGAAVASGTKVGHYAMAAMQSIQSTLGFHMANQLERNGENANDHATPAVEYPDLAENRGNVRRPGGNGNFTDTGSLNAGSAGLNEHDLENVPDLGAPENVDIGENGVPDSELDVGGYQMGGAGAAGGGSPGGGGVGGGSTSPATGGGSEEKSAQYAGLGDNGAKYASATYGGGGGRGGRRSKGGNSSLNLKSLLSQFLPGQKKDEKKEKSILDYGGRRPSAMQGSLLARKVNIFRRVHQTYQKKGRKGSAQLN